MTIDHTERRKAHLTLVAPALPLDKLVAHQDRARGRSHRSERADRSADAGSEHLPLAVPGRVTGHLPFTFVNRLDVASMRLEGEHSKFVGLHLGCRRFLELPWPSVTMSPRRSL